MSFNKIAVIVSIFALILVFLYPLFTHFSTHTTSPNDGPLIIWLIHQSAKAWVGEGSWYNWPFFYPYLLTATYSDPFVTSGLILLPLKLFFQNLVVQHNVLILIGTASNFFAMYILGKAIWRKSWPAWVAAGIFAFSYLQLQFVVHLHTYLLAGVPLGLWALLRYRKTKKVRFLLFLAISFLAQMLNAPMTGYFFIAVMTVYLVSEHIFWQVLGERSVQLTVALCLFISIWFYLPYLVTAERYETIRTIRDAAHFSFPINRLLWPDVLSSIALILLLIQQKKAKNPSYLSLKTAILITLLGGFFMLGPVIKVHDETLKIFGIPMPLPYAIAYYVIPGLQAFRAVTRWSVIFNFGLALVIGTLISHTKLPRIIQVLGTGIWIIVMLWLVRSNFPLFAIQTTVPPIYQILAEQPEITLVELPIYQWNMVPFDGIEDDRLLYQLTHEKKLYNGVSGFMPPERSLDINLHFQEFPSQKSLDRFDAAGVKLILVHFDEYQQMANFNFEYAATTSPTKNQLKEELEAIPNLEVVACTDSPNDCLYRLY